MIDEYVAGADRLEGALGGLTEADLDAARKDGKWTIRQILHHVADAEAIWSIALKAAIGNSGCTFDIGWYPRGNAWAERLDYAKRSVADAVGNLRAARRHTAQLVKHMRDDVWKRHVVFVAPGLDEGKRLTVTEIIRWQTSHLDLHIEQIRETRQVHDL
jgi:hypothetical protein